MKNGCTLLSIVVTALTLFVQWIFPVPARRPPLHPQLLFPPLQAGHPLQHALAAVGVVVAAAHRVQQALAFLTNCERDTQPFSTFLRIQS